MEFQYRRAPAIQKNISDINEKDIRVRLLGRIIDKNDSLIVIDDGTGKADIVFDPELIDIKAGTGDIVRIFTRVLPLEEGYELRAEIVQGMNGLDYELYKKVFGG